MSLPLRTLLAAIALPVLSVQAADHTFDVVVYGSTPAGVVAAVGAAREGAKVALVEPTDHIGGVNTGGLSFSDSNQTLRSTLGGLFEEFHQRMEDDYASRGIKLPYSVAIKDHSNWTYEPHVAARVTDAMLKEANVAVFPKQILSEVDKDGTAISKIKTRAGDSFAAKTFIDGTYEGDLMAAAGVSWTIGREGRNEFGETLAGKQYPKRPMNFSGLDADGKLLPLITTADGGADEDGDNRVMVYSFRIPLTRDPELKVPFPAPKNYDPARFEAVRRFYQSTKRAPFPWDLYPLPGNKLDGNNAIGRQFSLGHVGAPNGWSEATPEERQRIWAEHKEYTLQMYHFFATDPAIPKNIRDRMASLGLCKDEFVEHGHWPPQLYVREGRRMKGSYVITQHDIFSTPAKEDPIAVSSFPIDSHDVQRIALPDGTVINEGTIFPVRVPNTKAGAAFHIPYRSITPKAEECTNLLVPVALSCTHVAISSIRVEPTWMAIGHSAGIAAALAAKDGVAVQQLDYPKLRERMLAQKQILDYPEQPGREKLVNFKQRDHRKKD